MKSAGLIIYNSSTGFTQEYCEMIGNETGLETMSWKKARRLRSFPEIVVFGTWLHAGHVQELKAASRLLSRFGARRLILVVTGAAPSVSERDLDAMIAKSMRGEPFPGDAFYLPAGLRYERMRPIDRLLMSGLRAMLRADKKDPQKSRQMLEAISSSYDISSPSNIVPVVTEIRNALDK